MKHRSSLSWIVFVICIGTGFVLGRISSLETTQARTAGGAAVFLPSVDRAAVATQPPLDATLAALVQKNAQQATSIASWSAAVSYLLTQVPAQDRVRTTDALVYQRAELSTQVAALYSALGSPVPTAWPTPTFGPSPLPTLTPYIPLPSPTQTPVATP
jgi:hypothetical protein